MTTAIEEKQFKNHLTGGVLRKDRRGRVRFGHAGLRFDVARSGITVYARTSYGEMAMKFSVDGIFAGYLMENPKFLRTLANAIDLAHEEDQ